MENKRKKTKENANKKKIERNRGFIGVKLITESSELLRVNVNCRYKAIVLFHKYIEGNDFISTIIACLNIANKLEEQDCSLKQIVYIISYLKALYEGSTSIYNPSPTINYSEYIEIKEKVIKIELEILLDNNFNIQIEDLYECFMKEFIDDKENTIISCFYKLNTILFLSDIIFLKPNDIIQTIKDDIEYKEKIKSITNLKDCKINLIDFTKIKIPSNLSKSLLRNFLNRK